MPLNVLSISYNRWIISVWCINECLKDFVSNSVHINYSVVILHYTCNFSFISNSLYVQFLRHGSGADRLLGLRVRMPPEGMEVSLL